MNLIFKFILSLLIFILPFRSIYSDSIISIPAILGFFLIIVFSVMLINGDLKIKQDLLIFIFLLFMFDLLLAIYHMNNFYNNIFELLFNRYKLLLFLFTICSWCNSINKKIFIINCIKISAILASLYSIYIFISYKDLLFQLNTQFQTHRTFTPMYDASYCALYLCMTLPFFLYSIKNKTFNYICVILIVLAVLFTFNRFSYLLIIVLLLYKMKDSFSSKSFKKIIYNISIISGIILISQFLLIKLEFFNFLQERFFSLTEILTSNYDHNTFTSFYRRTLNFKAFMELFYEYPLFGVGIGNAKDYAFSTGILYIKGTLDNLYFQLISEQGLLYAIFYFSGFYFLIKKVAIKYNNIYDVMIIRSIVLFFLGGFSFYNEYMWIPYIIIGMRISNNQNQQ